MNGTHQNKKINNETKLNLATSFVSLIPNPSTFIPIQAMCYKDWYLFSWNMEKTKCAIQEFGSLRNGKVVEGFANLSFCFLSFTNLHFFFFF